MMLNSSTTGNTALRVQAQSVTNASNYQFTNLLLQQLPAHYSLSDCPICSPLVQLRTIPSSISSNISVRCWGWRGIFKVVNPFRGPQECQSNTGNLWRINVYRKNRKPLIGSNPVKFSQHLSLICFIWTDNSGGVVWRWKNRKWKSRILTETEVHFPGTTGACHLVSLSKMDDKIKWHYNETEIY